MSFWGPFIDEGGGKACSTMLQYTGYDVIDIKNKKVEIPSEFRNICEIIRTNEENKEHDNEIAKKYDQVTNLSKTVIQIADRSPLLFSKIYLYTYEYAEIEREPEIFAVLKERFRQLSCRSVAVCICKCEYQKC